MTCIALSTTPSPRAILAMVKSLVVLISSYGSVDVEIELEGKQSGFVQVILLPD
jgi:hypothetical protein